MQRQLKSKLEKDAKPAAHKKVVKKRKRQWQKEITHERKQDKKERQQLPVGVGGSGRRPVESADPGGGPAWGCQDRNVLNGNLFSL